MDDFSLRAPDAPRTGTRPKVLKAERQFYTVQVVVLQVQRCTAGSGMAFCQNILSSKHGWYLSVLSSAHALGLECSSHGRGRAGVTHPNSSSRQVLPETSIVRLARSRSPACQAPTQNLDPSTRLPDISRELSAGSSTAWVVIDQPAGYAHQTSIVKEAKMGCRTRAPRRGGGG